MSEQSEQRKEEQEVGSSSHKMSIALTIGATIGVIGLILVFYGLFGGADYHMSGNINVNLWWGLVMVVFGILMGGGSYLSSRRKAALR